MKHSCRNTSLSQKLCSYSNGYCFAKHHLHESAQMFKMFSLCGHRLTMDSYFLALQQAYSGSLWTAHHYDMVPSSSESTAVARKWEPTTMKTCKYLFSLSCIQASQQFLHSCSRDTLSGLLHQLYWQAVPKLNFWQHQHTILHNHLLQICVEWWNRKSEHWCVQTRRSPAVFTSSTQRGSICFSSRTHSVKLSSCKPTVANCPQLKAPKFRTAVEKMLPMLPPEYWREPP